MSFIRKISMSLQRGLNVRKNWIFSCRRKLIIYRGTIWECQNEKSETMIYKSNFLYVIIWNAGIYCIADNSLFRHPKCGKEVFDRNECCVNIWINFTFGRRHENVSSK